MEDVFSRAKERWEISKSLTERCITSIEIREDPENKQLFVKIPGHKLMPFPRPDNIDKFIDEFKTCDDPLEFIMSRAYQNLLKESVEQTLNT